MSIQTHQYQKQGTQGPGNNCSTGLPYLSPVNIIQLSQSPLHYLEVENNVALWQDWCKAIEYFFACSFVVGKQRSLSSHLHSVVSDREQVQPHLANAVLKT